MFSLEIKILLLTVIYFMGWFLFEKFFSGIWDKVQTQFPKPKKSPATKPAFIGTITPLDQTTRYIRGLKNPDWRVRRISCIQLGEKRGSAVVQALIQALNDPREEVSMAASDALTKIGDPMAIQALTEHLQRLDKNVEESFERSRAA